MSKFTININGKIFTEENAVISVLDRGFLYGDSVYEATRTFFKTPFRINEHLDRLFESAQKIYFEPIITKEEILAEIKKTVENSPFENQALRIVLSRGVNMDLGLDPDLAIKENLIIYSKELKPNPKWWLEKGVDLVFYQKLTSSKGSLAKTGDYVENMLAFRSAKEAGAYDAIMINNDGHITESTTSNIWIIKEGLIKTPPLSDGVLAGLTRQKLIEIGKNMQLKIEETSLKTSDFYSADECFITSTTRLIVPVTKINQKPIGNGKIGQITLNLLKTYQESIEKDLGQKIF